MVKSCDNICDENDWFHFLRERKLIWTKPFDLRTLGKNAKMLGLPLSTKLFIHCLHRPRSMYRYDRKTTFTTYYSCPLSSLKIGYFWGTYYFHCRPSRSCPKRFKLYHLCYISVSRNLCVCICTIIVYWLLFKI